MLETELNDYLDKVKKSQLSGDVDEQFIWLEKITDYLYQHNSNVNELTRYLNMRLDLARKTDRLDQEMWAMIAFRSLYHIAHNDQEELRCLEKVHYIGMQIKAIKEPENIRFRNLRGEEALKMVDVFLSQNDATLQKMKMR